MKVGVFSDIHLHKFLPFSRDGGVDRLHNILNHLFTVFELFIEEGCSKVIFAGDFFHTRHSIDVQTFAIVLNGLRDFADRHSKWFDQLHGIAIPGQHDFYRRTGGETALLFLSEFGFDVIWKKPVWLGLDRSTRICAVPWMPAGDLRSCLRKLKNTAKSGTYSILLTHGVPKGFRSPSGFVFEEGIEEKYYKPFDLCLSGDIHQPQRSGNVVMIGAPLHHDFGDAGGERGCWVFDTKSRALQFHPIRGVGPEFRIVTDPSEINDSDYFRYECTSVTEVKEFEFRWNVEVELTLPKKEVELVSGDVSRTPKSMVEDYARKAGGGFDLDRLIEVGSRFIE